MFFVCVDLGLVLGHAIMISSNTDKAFAVLFGAVVSWFPLANSFASTKNVTTKIANDASDSCFYSGLSVLRVNNTL